MSGTNSSKTVGKTNKVSCVSACEGLRPGDEIDSFCAGILERFIDEMGDKIDSVLLSVRISRKCNCLPLKMVTIGTIVHNIGNLEKDTAKYCRAVGVYGRLVLKLRNENEAIIQL